FRDHRCERSTQERSHSRAGSRAFNAEDARKSTQRAQRNPREQHFLFVIQVSLLLRPLRILAFSALNVSFLPSGLQEGAAPDHVRQLSNRRCFTLRPWRRSSFSASMPMRMWLSTYSADTLASEASVLTPSGIIGWSDTSSSAPLGMRLAKPAAKMVAVSMSMAMQRVLRR